jgi:hypothetical protein
MQVQLALEDESRSKEERKQLQTREAEFLKEHEREWLGELAPFVLDEDRENGFSTGAEPIWERGFLSGLVVRVLSTGLAQALHDPVATRFVRGLHIHAAANGDYFGEEHKQPPPRVSPPARAYHRRELFELTGAPLLANLRVFRMGYQEPQGDESYADCHVYTPAIEHLIAHMPRVEELHLLCKNYESANLFALPNHTHLRVLRMYHLDGRHERYEHALDVLAANPAFASLTHLLIHPHRSEWNDTDIGFVSYLPLDQIRALVHSPHLPSLTHLQLRLSDMGDDGAREFIASGVLKRLKWLDLRHGCVTDAGASLLAACPDAKNLEWLDLSRNAVTSAGLAALRAAGVNAVANNPLTQTELAERDYLCEGDGE